MNFGVKKYAYINQSSFRMRMTQNIGGGTKWNQNIYDGTKGTGGTK